MNCICIILYFIAPQHKKRGRESGEVRNLRPGEEEQARIENRRRRRSGKKDRGAEGDGHIKDRKRI